MSKPDLISIIEAMYADKPDEHAWLGEVLAAAEPTLDLGLGTMAYTFFADPVVGPQVLNTAARGSHGTRLLQSSLNMVDEQGIKTMGGFRSQVSLLSDIAKPPLLDAKFIGRHFDRVGNTGNASDVLGIVGADSSGHGMLLTALVPFGWKLMPSFRRHWGCISAHLASARRLRTRTHGVQDEAVLDLSGKLYDAVGSATSRQARTALRLAARAIDRSRAQRSNAPNSALEGWQALVDGRWSLVDRFESDGRTFLIARPNPPRPPNVGKLTPQERAVVAVAALGRPNKLIAYELGLSTGSVGNYLSRAQQKFGVASRAMLIREFLFAARELAEAEKANAKSSASVASTLLPAADSSCADQR